MGTGASFPEGVVWCLLPFTAANPPWEHPPGTHQPHQASGHHAWICGLSPLLLSGQRTRCHLHVAGKPRAICLPSAVSNRFFLPRWPLCALNWKHHGLPSSTENLLLSPSATLPPPPLLPLSQFLLFLPCTGNCEPVRESPGVFSSKRYPAVLRRAQRTAVNVTLSPCSCTCWPPRPLRFTRGSPSARRFSGGRRATMFSVHSEIKSTTFDPSNLFCG